MSSDPCHVWPARIRWPGMTLSIVASRAVKLNGFWMHGLGARPEPFPSCRDDRT